MPKPPTRTTEPVPLAPRDLLLLAALAEGPCHGYGLIERVANLSEDSVRLDPANLYRALRRMERDDWIERLPPSRDDRSTPGKPRRRVGLSPIGRQVLALELRRLDDLVMIYLSVKIACVRFSSAGEHFVSF